MFCANLGASLSASIPAGTYWVSQVGQVTPTDTLVTSMSSVAVALNADGTAVTIGTIDLTYTSYFGAPYMAITAADGSLVRNRHFGPNSSAGSSSYGQGALITAGGSLYIVGSEYSTGVLGDAFIAKIDQTTDTALWGYGLGSTASAVDSAVGVAVDSADNVYMVGAADNAGGTGTTVNGLIAKYSSAGTIQWQRTLNGGATYFYGCAIDSSDNIYAVGSGSATVAYLAKYTTAGALTYQKTLTSAQFYGCCVDTTGNVYACGKSGTAGLVVSYDATGAILWQRTLTLTNVTFNKIAIDSSGNLYVAGASGNNVLLACYSSAGTLQWQRTLRYTPGTALVSAFSIVNSAGALLVGFTRGITANLIKIPKDGSLTGTYGSYEYIASSLTDAASSLTAGAGSKTHTVSTLVNSAYALGTGNIISVSQYNSTTTIP